MARKPIIPRLFSGKKSTEVPSKSLRLDHNENRSHYRHPWGIYRFRDLWHHKPFLLTLLVLSISALAYGTAIFFKPSQAAACTIAATGFTAIVLRRFFGRHHQEIDKSMLAFVIVWSAIGSGLVFIDHFGSSVADFVERIF